MLRAIGENKQIEKKTCVCGSEELILLKFPSCPKSSTLSMQSSSKYQGILYSNRRNTLKILSEHIDDPE